MRRLLIGLVVVALVLVGADLLSKHVVEGRLADHIENRDGVDGVGVDIAGFPFLTQVVAGHFDEVDVSMPRLRARTAAGSVALEDVQLTFEDVKTSDRFTRATAARATGTGLVPYSAFDAIPGVQVAYGGETPDGTGYLEVSAPSLGGGSVRVVPSVADGAQLRLDARSPVRRALPLGLRTFVSSGLDFAGLIDGVTVRSIDATPDGIVATLAGRHLTVAR